MKSLANEIRKIDLRKYYINPCSECDSEDVDFEFTDTIKTNMYLECLHCKRSSAAASLSSSVEEMVKEAVSNWNQEN